MTVKEQRIGRRRSLNKFIINDQENYGLYDLKNAQNNIHLSNVSLPESIPNGKIETVTYTHSQTLNKGQEQKGNIYSVSATKTEISPILTTTKTLEVYTLLDPEHLESSHSPFRGIFYLHWLCMIFVCISIFLHNYRIHGYLLGSNLYHLMTFDIKSFIIADLYMVFSLYTVVGIQKLFIKGWFPIRYAFFIRYFFQSCLLVTTVYYVHTKAWPYVQTVVFILHTMAMFMKVHSYLSTNELMHKKWKRTENKKLQNQQRRLSNGLNYDSEGLLDDCIHIHGPLQYPDNVTLSNFTTYLLIPTLLYQVNFPRTSKIRWGTVIEKTFSALVAFLLMYIIVEHWLQPIMFNLETMSLGYAIAELLFPFTVFYILGFYLVFECLCNWCSELTRYGNRSFYDDWWNSTTFDQFARKWNKPVHQFLYHHIYESCMKTYGWSKSSSTIFTFLFSSILHEFVMTVVCKRIRFYFLALQMCQLPLIYIGKIPMVKKHKLTCNLLFWVAMMVGPPMLALLYSRDYFLYEDWRKDYKFYSELS